MAPETEADLPAPPSEPAAAPPRLPRYRGIRFLVSLKWLGAGILLYALLLVVAMAGNPAQAAWPIVGPSLYLTPMFGLPLVLATAHRPGRARRLIYFLLLLPLAHIAANYAAWSYAVTIYDPFDPSGDALLGLRAGGVGGLVGAVLSFTLFHLTRLASRRRAELLVMGLATAALTAIGAGGMMLGLTWSQALANQHDTARAIIWFECVHPPWQAAFAFVLAWLMRPIRAHRQAVVSDRTAPAS